MKANQDSMIGTLASASSLRKLALTLACCVAYGVAASAAPLSFGPRQDFQEPGPGPQSIAAADFNGDGKIDLAIVGFGGVVCITPNRTDVDATVSNFGSPPCLAVQPGIQQSVAAADLNGDGKPDLIVTNTYDNTISVLLNTTQSVAVVPTFTSQQTFATGAFPYSVAVADINGDGKPDLVVANSKDGTVSVLLNTTPIGASSASFSAQQTFAVGSLPVSIAVADVNGDGRPDLIAANASDGTVSVLINTTLQNTFPASFSAQRVFAIGTFPYSIATADINGDGKPDVVTANMGDGTVAVLLNTTATGANIPSYATQRAFPAGVGPVSIAAADLDGDGKPDVVVANQHDNTISVFINTTGNGAQLASFSIQQIIATGINPQALAAADVNGDGRPDLITGNDSDFSLSVSLNNTGNVNLDQHGLTGSWFNPATSGQGFEIEAYPDLHGPGQGTLFAGWFTYDVTAAGGRRWYGITGDVTAANPTATLQIFALEGGNFNAPPTEGATSALGTATITFSDCNTGTLSYTFTDGSGRSDTIPMIRLTPNVTCSPSGDNGTAPGDYLLSGNWFNPTTSGQGIIFDFAPSINTLFAAWYTFIPNGQASGGPASENWFTLQSAQWVDGMTSLANIAIVDTSGGIFDNPAPVTSEQVGTASISFQSCDAMTLAYQFTAGQNKGLTGMINLQRAGPTPAGCSL